MCLLNVERVLNGMHLPWPCASPRNHLPINQSHRDRAVQSGVTRRRQVVTDQPDMARWNLQLHISLSQKQDGACAARLTCIMVSCPVSGVPIMT